MSHPGLGHIESYFAILDTSGAPPQSLSISLLGHAEVHLDGKQVRSRFQPKVLALLAYLAAERRPHSREHLIELFWPDVEAETARSNLRVTLYRLRQTLGNERYLHTTRDSLALDPDSVDTDVAGFLSPLGQDASPAQLETRMALYRGTFLADCLLECSPDFSDWLALKRETCHRQAVTLADRLVASYEQDGEFGNALRHAGRRLDLAPWEEDGYRCIMTLLALDQQQGAALAQYEVCRNVLAREFGAAPSPETTELWEHIKAGRLAPEVARRRPFSFLGKTASAALNKALNVLIVDDHLLFRVGLSLMLNELGPDVTVFEAASCEEALVLAEPQAGFDIILLDLKFPGMSGLDGLQLFRKRHPVVPVVLFSSDGETGVIETSRARGASGYISKGMGAEAIVDAIETVLSGGMAFPFELVHS